MDVDAARKNHRAVDWAAYFDLIRDQCPWSWRAWQQGLIDIQTYAGHAEPMGHWQARMYVLVVPDVTAEALAHAHDLADSHCEWLYSYPGLGDWATPVTVLIQQPRQRLQQLRAQLATADPDQT